LLRECLRRSLSENTCLLGWFALYVTSLTCLLVGWRTRWAAAVSWFTHLTLKTTGNAAAYGVVEFANIALLYCMVSATWVGAVSESVRGPGPICRLAGGPPGTASVSVASVYRLPGLGSREGDRPTVVERRGGLASPNAAGLCEGTLAMEIGYSFLAWPR
jgi:hypothetical protein